MTLEEAREHVNAGVAYLPPGGRREDGVITSVNERFVFVRYDGDTSAIATHPTDLVLLSEPCS